MNGGVDREKAHLFFQNPCFKNCSVDFVASFGSLQLCLSALYFGLSFCFHSEHYDRPAGDCRDYF